MRPQDIILCLHPRKLTVSDVRQMLLQRNDVSRQALADLILHRLIDRYITPLEHVRNKPIDYRSGFLTMAACCLMIETFQCFRDGKKDTEGVGKATFRKFFTDYSSKFSAIDGGDFYEKIRCGILHQAQTQGRFRILRRGPIFDNIEKSINSARFLSTLKAIVESYVAELRIQDMEDRNWKNALRKIKHICDAIEHG